MAIGRPIITCDSVGCRETVEHEKNGFLVNIRDVKDLVEKMKSFISNPKLIKEMGFESRKIAEKRFNVNNINDEIYQTLKMDNKLKTKNFHYFKSVFLVD